MNLFKRYFCIGVPLLSEFLDEKRKSKKIIFYISRTMDMEAVYQLTQI